MRPFHFLSNAVRAKTIVSVLVRYGFHDILRQLETPPGWLTRLVTPKSEGLNTWQRIRLACEELGPTFIKIGQILSTRPDVVPQPLIEELRSLRDRVHPQPFAPFRTVIQEDLQGGVDDFFTDWKPDPIAAGSIAQIYRARLKGDGGPVAVKIQRPDIRNAILADLEILSWLAHQVNLHVEALQPFDLPTVVEELRTGLLRELDFTNEARHATVFNTVNPYTDRVFAPRVHDALSTSRVLVTEWVDGSSPERLALSDPERHQLAFNGGTSVFHQIIIAGFFHADPHSGNILITPDRRICFIDWGLVGQLTRRMRYFLADLFSAVAVGDAERVVRVASAMVENRRIPHQSKLEKEVAHVLYKYNNLQAGSQAVGRLILELLYLFGSNGIHLVRDYTLLGKAVISIEETGKGLDPEFQIPKVAEPFIQQLTWERWNPTNLARQGYLAAMSSLSDAQQLPGDFHRLIRRLEDEDISLQLNHRGLREFEETLNAATNRMVLGIILGALIIGSSLVITTDVEPYFLGYPVVGIIGYLISALLGFWIVIDIVRRGRHR